MNMSYGGQASQMYNTTITEIGPHDQQFPIGAFQTMMFIKSDSGLFWLDEETRILENYDT